MNERIQQADRAMSALVAECQDKTGLGWDPSFADRYSLRRVLTFLALQHPDVLDEFMGGLGK